MPSLVQVVVVAEFYAEGDGQCIILLRDELWKIFYFHKFAVAPALVDVELGVMLFHNVELLVGRVDDFDLIDIEIERIRVVNKLKEERDVLWVCASFRIQH